MKTVKIIGVSGTGKSTLVKNLKQKLPLLMAAYLPIGRMISKKPEQKKSQ